ncbi:fimbrial protein [Chania multitudinisentens RB-25]|uniref:Fimbrial protein n=1 Tax=Chania multitudinisentens RB-25 TaxID=1441930 RepID=W0L870_9GAMM|nr:fimbria/pilus chaperone family protein [Chania multitudinisentens]AHG18589.2 fimbrial protein [Chania multitudinisentens RB-25]
MLHPFILSTLRWLGLFAALLLATQAQASFKLESTTIILNESEGRVSFNIQNMSSAPILLVSKLIDLDNNNLSKQILISPPITRIDAGQSQQINFVLKQGTPLTHEVLLKASFEGVSQAADNSAKMPIRQDIGFIVQPSAVVQTKTPWEELKFSVEGQQLVIANPGKHVVRLAPQVTLLPANKIVPLKNYYLMAGETQRVAITGTPTSVTIIPLSRYGLKLPEVTLPVGK